MWDYNIPVNEIENIISGKSSHAQHYTKETIFRKMLESYAWFTILQIFSPKEIKNMLTNDVINKIRIPSLKKKYEFVRQRLSEII
jgi:hypothetical protein